MAERTVPEQNRDLPATPDQEERPLTTREETRYLMPPVDIYETEEGLTAVFDMPGVANDEIDIRVDQGMLTVKGGLSHERPGTPIHEEFQLMSYFRQFELSDTVDPVGITAELSLGVLTLKLPRAERTKPKTIAIDIKS